MQTKRVLLALLFACFMPILATAQVLTITDLGPLEPTAINTWAQVAGNYNKQAYIWSFGHLNTLGILAGGTFSSASAINDLGVVVGTADGPGTVIDPVFGNQACSDLIQPFLWKNHAMQGLGTISTAEFTGLGVTSDCLGQYYGTALNDFGEVVGNTPFLGNLYQWGFSWNRSSAFTLLGGSWQPTFVTGVSNAGQIVGQNAEGPFLGHATSWKGGVATDLGSLLSSGSTYVSAANGVNDLGAIVGWSVTETVPPPDCVLRISQDCPIHAVLWTNTGAIIDLGTLAGDTLSSATKINLFGLIIGESGSAVAFQQDPETGVQGPPLVTGRPFLWSQKNGMQDLNTLIPSSSGWVLNTATDINVWGQIVGEGELNGQPHGYLLTPKDLF